MNRVFVSGRRGADLGARTANNPAVLNAIDVAPIHQTDRCLRSRPREWPREVQSVEPAMSSEFQRGYPEVTFRIDLEVDHVPERLAVAHHACANEVASRTECVALTGVHLSLPGMNRKMWSRIHWSPSPTSYASDVCL